MQDHRRRYQSGAADREARRPFVEANDVVDFLEPYSVKQLYIDPSAASFKEELRRRGLHTIDANNEVLDGITVMTSEMKKGNLFVCKECKNMIREIESYSWDPRKAKIGIDEPIKRDDHAVDALRYCIASHKIAEYRPYKDDGPNDYLANRFNPMPRRF